MAKLIVFSFAIHGITMLRKSSNNVVVGVHQIFLLQMKPSTTLARRTRGLPAGRRPLMPADYKGDPSAVHPSDGLSGNPLNKLSFSPKAAPIPRAAYDDRISALQRERRERCSD